MGSKGECSEELFKVLMSFTKEQLESLPVNMITMFKGRIKPKESA